MNASRGERKEVRLSTSEGMPTGALYVFARMLMRLEEDNTPARMAVVFDDKGGKKTFRAEMYAAYKATRKEPPEELPGPDGVLREDRAGARLAGARGARRRGRRRDRDAACARRARATGKS